MMDIQAYLPQLEKIWIKHGVVLAYLFGSQAEGTAGPLSDIDIAALLRPYRLKERGMAKDRWSDPQIDLIGDLCHLFHRNDVDVVILNQATPLLMHQVVKYGKVIYEDPVTRPAVDFAAYTISRYADTIPLRQIQHRYFFERMEQRRAATKTQQEHKADAQT
jgi:predicted nucleotidyltransferase